MPKKIIILGWDCAAPRLIFDRFRDKLPNVGRIMQHGLWGNLRSIIPPITIPAWRCMVTGKTPGELGLWGFRHRSGDSYTDFDITTSIDIERNAIWDIIGTREKKSICSAIPPSYPPYEINGNLISCFMTPSVDRQYTYPESLKNEISGLVGEYPVDTEFRVDDKDRIRDTAFEMTDKHFRVFEHLLKNKGWDFAMHVEIGLDRIQHAFWRYFDESHHLYEKDSKYRNVVADYYRLLDDRLGRIMEMADDETLVIVASDHGAKPMEGAFCVNQWLAKEGYLKLRNKPQKGQGIRDADILWKKTSAWGWGGYYSRIFFNVKGRESQGCIKQKNLSKEIEKLKKKIKNIRGPKGEEWNTIVLTPDEAYENSKGQKPDLMVFWDDLSWRSAGTLGHDTMYLKENDTGPDDGVHDWDGIIMAWKRNWNKGSQLTGVNLLDIFPTVMKYLDVDIEYFGKGRATMELLDEQD
jgi:predicted AlkP superfamily phosphohydrolase/phosphomutase